MKNTTYRVAFGCIISFLCYSMSAQYNPATQTVDPGIHETNNRQQDYQELKNLGYQDAEIFEDLGNANFLLENYETALFWYRKLEDVSSKGSMSSGFQTRYQFALEQTGAKQSSGISKDQDWFAMIQSDYQVQEVRAAAIPGNELAGKYMDYDFQQRDLHFSSDQLMVENDPELMHDEKPVADNHYKAPIALTADGQTAYFTKATYVKPLYGIFSKKELVHKIYKAEKVDGQWKNISEVALCPKNFSTMHPAISEDGKRLFFASDMPGTFGKYDIYVADIQRDGSLGIAKNLGEKVNTKENDLYPNLTGGNTLFYASAGREGHGGMDVFMVQVDRKKVGRSVNLGSPINSTEDDFSISMGAGPGTGYVMTNRGNQNDAVRKVAFSYADTRKNTATASREFNISAALNNELKIDYSSTVFEDE